MISLYHSGVDEYDLIEIYINPFSESVPAISFHKSHPLIAFNGLISMPYYWIFTNQFAYFLSLNCWLKITFTGEVGAYAMKWDGAISFLKWATSLTKERAYFSMSEYFNS